MPTILIPGLVTAGPPFSAKMTRQVLAGVDAARRTAAKPQPKFRIGPDLTFVIVGDDERQKTFELIADGALLRDPSTHEVWPFPLGKRMLAELAPVRRLADGEREGVT